MDINFQGFQPLLPVWLFLLIFVGTTLLAWWSYKDVTGIHRPYIYILSLLRSTAFFILLVLLLNPVFRSESTNMQPPSVLVMLDNSASTSIEKGNYSGIDSYNRVLEELDIQNANADILDIFSFGNTVQPTPLNDLSFNDDQTDLSASIQKIEESADDINAAILVSDGIYTKGQNPVYQIQELSVPIFTIALGDTATNKDVLVSSVSTNPTGYLNTHQSVTATIRSTGFEGDSFSVRLQKDDEVISSQSHTPEISKETTDISFDLRLDTEGLQQYQIVIPEVNDEWTTANNIHRFSIDVRDAKQQIVSLAFEIHPDVRFIRSLLEQDQNIQVTSRTWLGGNRFMEGTVSMDPDTVDLAIIHGFPSTGLPDAVARSVAELSDDVPVILASTPSLDLQGFNQKIVSLPVTASSQWNYSPVSLSPDVSSSDHPIMDLPAINYEQVNTVSAPVKNVELAPGASILFESVYQGKSIQKPLLAVQEMGNKRMAVFTGFNWYHMNQSTVSETRQFIRQLWLNTVSWTVTDPDNQLLQIHPEKTTFSESEPVVLNAHLTNERGETESQATVDITISSDSVPEKFYSMENVGAGRYHLETGSMPEGVYSFNATAQKDERTIDSKSGEFTVARSNAEFLNTRRNEQLLRQLSQRTGGSYIPFDSVSIFWNRLDEKGILEPTEEVETTLIYPYHHLAWFALILLILTAEWSLRKYLSLP